MKQWWDCSVCPDPTLHSLAWLIRKLLYPDLLGIDKFLDAMRAEFDEVIDWAADRFGDRDLSPSSSPLVTGFR